MLTLEEAKRQVDIIAQWNGKTGSECNIRFKQKNYSMPNLHHTKEWESPAFGKFPPFNIHQYEYKIVTRHIRTYNREEILEMVANQTLVKLIDEPLATYKIVGVSTQNFPILQYFGYSPPLITFRAGFPHSIRFLDNTPFEKVVEE